MSHGTMHETLFRFSLFLVRSLTIQQSYKFTVRVNTDRIVENQNYLKTYLVTCAFS